MLSFGVISQTGVTSSDPLNDGIIASYRLSFESFAALPRQIYRRGRLLIACVYLHIHGRLREESLDFGDQLGI